MTGPAPGDRTAAVNLADGAESPVRDGNGTPAWQLVPEKTPRPDGLPTRVVDSSRLESPLLRRILTVLRRDYDSEFAFRWLGPLPFAPLRKPLSQVRAALVTTACLHLRGDRPFDPYSNRWGDPSHRFVPHASPAGDLDLEADYVDEKYVRRDPEVALPRRALQHWVNEGLVGSAGERHLSFCEGVVRPIPGMAESAREALRALRADGVEAALLLPSCSLCVINVCVIAREAEAAGIATSTVTPLPEATAIAGVPRGLAVKFPLGAPCGDPGNAGLQRQVVRSALTRLEENSEPGAVTRFDGSWRAAP